MESNQGTITAIAGPNGVILPRDITKLNPGETKAIKVMADSGCIIKFVKINSVLQETNYQREFDYSFTPYPSQCLVVEAEFAPSNFVFFVEGFLYEKYISIRQDGKIVDYAEYSGDCTTVKYFFRVDGTVESFNADGTHDTSPFPWELIDNNTLRIGSSINSILFIDDKNIVISSPGFYNFKPATYEANFWRP